MAIVSRHTLFPALLGDRLCALKTIRSFECYANDEGLKLGKADLVLVESGVLCGKVEACVSDIRKRAGAAKVMLIIDCGGGYLAHLAIRFGLNGVAHQADTFEDLYAGIRLVLAGGVFFSPRVDMVNRALFSRVLSNREIAILAELAAGVSNGRLARRYGISTETVRTHRRNCMRKVGARTQLELTRFAVSQGLIRLI